MGHSNRRRLFLLTADRGHRRGFGSINGRATQDKAVKSRDLEAVVPFPVRRLDGFEVRQQFFTLSFIRVETTIEAPFGARPVPADGARQEKRRGSTKSVQNQDRGPGRRIVSS